MLTDTKSVYSGEYSALNAQLVGDSCSCNATSAESASPRYTVDFEPSLKVKQLGCGFIGKHRQVVMNNTATVRLMVASSCAQSVSPCGG